MKFGSAMHRVGLLAGLSLTVLLMSCGGGGNDAASASATSTPTEARAKALSFFPPGATIPTDADQRGMWSPVYNWPVISVHAVVLPDGRVLTYGSSLAGQQGATSGQNGANPNYDIWDSTGAPDAGHMNVIGASTTEIFCSSNVLLPPASPTSSAKVFIAGGDLFSGGRTLNSANRNSNLLDVPTNALTRQNDMTLARWYSTSTTLTNGEVYIQGGTSGEANPEVRTTSGTFRALTGANTSTLHAFFPRNFVAPDGRVFGYDTNGLMYYVDTSGSGSINILSQTLPSTYRGDSGSAAMFRPGRILQLSGASSAAAVIDITSGTPVVTATQSQTSQRQWVNATILADGKVVATSGSRVRNELTDVNTKAEIWDPTTGQWMVGPAAVRPRLYHSNAILLPDASVLVTGGGATEPIGTAGTGPSDNLNSEIYYPPYLFAPGGVRASRPVIDSAPTWVDIGAVFALTVSNASSVSRVTMVKTGASTHSFNMDQRFVDLTFAANGLNLSVQAPARATDATPGYYMVFVFDQAGTPSVAKIVRVGVAPNPNPATVPTLANPGPRSNLEDVAISPLQLSASDPNGDTLTYSASGLPIGLSLNPTTGSISGVPTTPGSYNVVVTVSDGVNVASANFVWTITFNGAVVLDPMPPAIPVQAGVSASFTASSTGGGSNVQYRWNFGDGTGDSAWSTSASTTHTFASGGVYIVTVSVTDGVNVQSQPFVQTVYLPTTSNKPTASTNIAIQVPPSGNHRLWVVNQDNDTVSAFDAVTHAKLAEIAVGSAPRSIAVAPNGTIWVTNKRSDSISVIDPATSSVVATIALPRGSRPFGLAMSPTGSQAFVALEALGQLVKIDTGTRAVLGSVSAGAHARHVSVSANGSTVYVTRFITPPLPGEGTATVTTTLATGGEVVVFDAATLGQVRTIVLRHSEAPDAENQGRGIPNYLGAATISPDGTQAWVPSKQDNIKRGALRDGSGLNFQSTVRAISSRIDLAAGQEDYARRVDHDNAGVASAVAYDPLGVYLFVALETSREVAVIDAHGGYQVLRFDVGRAPQGLALSADGKKLFVNNFMDRTVGVFDLQPLLFNGDFSVPPITTLNAVATEKLAANVLLGKRHFYDARDTRIARDRYISCASCHNDGDGDGRTWDFTGAGEGLRNTISLRGRSGAQGLLHWSANFDEVQDFEGQIRALAGGSGLMSDTAFNTGTRSQPLGDPKAGLSVDLDALAAYVASLNTFEPSPHRASAGALTTAGAAGRDVFAAKGCAACHGGAGFTNSNTMGLQNIGTIKPSSGQRLGAALTGLDIPTLRDVWDTAPYLHDGSAATLDAAVLAHNGVSLTAGELSSLVQYLREIGADEPDPPVTGQPGLVTAYGLNEGTGGGTADQSGIGHTGTLVNGPVWTAAGRYGWALSFDGINDALSVGTPSTLSFAGDFTVMMWVKRNALGGTVQRHLFSKCDAASWVSGCKEFYFAGDTLRFGSWSTGDTSSVTIADTNWHHVGVVFTRATNAVQIYVDGSLRTSSTKNLEADGASHVVTIGNLMGKNTFSGLIDEVRIYSRPLTAAQLQTDMNTPLTPVGDVTPPVLSAGGPSGTLPAGTTQATLAVTSSESATCRYSTTAGVAYASMASTFAATGGTSHTTPVSGLANGQSYSFYVRCQDTSGNATTSDLVIAFSVGTPDTAAPSVNITAPAAGATVSGSVSVTASASDNVGVAGVQFLLDGAALGAEVTQPPYAVTWNTTAATNGTHALTARARDAAGNQTTSVPVSVTVSNVVQDTTPPSVSVTAPAGGTTVSGSVSVTASASDNVGVVGVQFLLDGAALGAEVMQAPFAVTWNTTAASNGTHVLTARARDAAGNQTTSLATSVTVSNIVADTVPPTVGLSSPADAATVTGTVSVAATATDNVGVAGVQFLLDGANLGAEVTVAPYQTSWNTTTATNATHVLTARARDAAGNTTSAQITVTVSNVVPDTTPPSATLTSPAAGASVSGTVAVTATATDNVGVAGVQFLLDGANLGAEVTVAPYTTSWVTTGATNGNHVLGARVRDAAGNQSTATTVNVVVSNGDGLVAAFGLDEGSGTTTADQTGGGHVGTLVNGPTWTSPGKFGSALSFDGVNDAVSVAAPSTIDLGSSSFTVMMWIKRNALGGSNAVQRHLFSKCDPARWVAGCKEFYFAGDMLRFGTKSAKDLNGVTIADTNWHHVAAVFTRTTNTLQLYVDGALVATGTRNIEADVATHVVAIGNMNGNSPFSGLIDEVRVYNRPLTLAQLQAAMTTPVTP